MKSWIYLLAAFGALVLLGGIFLAVKYVYFPFHHLEQVAATLPKEEALARKAGMPLTPAELQAPLPPPALNAALDYSKLRMILKLKPIPEAADNAISDIGTRNETAVDDKIASRLLASRPNLLAFIVKATKKPTCVFNRNWSLGSNLRFPEYRTMRAASRLISAQSVLLADKGRYRRAIALQACGFKLARQAASDPDMIAYLVGIAIDGSSLQGMQRILQTAGPNSRVDGEIVKVLEDNRPHFSLHHALKGEIVMGVVDIGMSASGKYRLNDKSTSKSDNYNRTGMPKNVMAKAGLAIYLREMRPIYQASTLPYPQRRAILTQLTNHLSDKMDNARKTFDVAWIIPAMLLPVFNPTNSELEMFAEYSVLLASSSVLSYRAQHGGFPKQLTQAGVSLTDPFNGKPLQYRLQGNGFEVYSVGRTGKFNGVPAGRRTRGEAYFIYPPVSQAKKAPHH